MTYYILSIYKDSINIVNSGEGHLQINTEKGHNWREINNSDLSFSDYIFFKFFINREITSISLVETFTKKNNIVSMETKKLICGI